MAAMRTNVPSELTRERLHLKYGMLVTCLNLEIERFGIAM